jgi:hypothetical protein
VGGNTLKETSGALIALALAAVAPMVVHAETAPVSTQAAGPALAAEAIDPARMAAARQVATALMPPGTYARVMNGTLDKMVGSMTDSMFSMPIADLAGMAGKKPEELKGLGKTTMAQVMAILDPHFRERSQRTTRAMFDGITALVVQFEPDIREGIAEAYARQFTIDQLNELNRFFATPTGKIYAANSMIIGTDPAVMSKVQGMMPAMLKQMPDIIQKGVAATADLPPPRKPDQLSPAERAELEKLLGTPITPAAAPKS